MSDSLEGKYKLHDELYQSSPDYREIYLREYKKKNPNAIVPELEVRDEIKKAKETTNEEIKKLREEIAKTEFDRKLEAKRQRALAIIGGDEKDLEKLEKMMVEDGISDYEKAAKYFNYERKMAEPDMGAGEPIKKFEMPDLSAIQTPEDRDVMGRKLISDAIADLEKAKKDGSIGKLLQ